MMIEFHEYPGLGFQKTPENHLILESMKGDIPTIRINTN
jgi:hypothetical protein